MVLRPVSYIFISVIHIVRHILFNRNIYPSNVCRIFAQLDIEQNIDREADYQVDEVDLGTIVSGCCFADYYQSAILHVDLCRFL